MARDRDDTGRPRNARPRDGLGRPLAYGAEGVGTQPPRQRTPEQTLRAAQQLLDAGRPFHAHEVLEEAWKAAPEPEQALWRGLAQLAVGLTHAARGNDPGAEALLRRGAGNIEAFRTRRCYGIDVAGLSRWATELADALAVGRADPADPAAGDPRGLAADRADPAGPAPGNPAALDRAGVPRLVLTSSGSGRTPGRNCPSPSPPGDTTP